MRKATRLFYFMMVLILSIAFMAPASADYGVKNEDDEFDPIFKSVSFEPYLCIEYYCLTDFDDYKWMTQEDVDYFLLNKVGYIPAYEEDEDFITLYMIHGELKLEKRTNTEYGKYPIFPDISVIPDDAYDNWSISGFLDKDWYTSDEVFDLILPYIDQDYSFYVSKDLSLFKFFINIEFEDESTYVYIPRKISIVSNNNGELYNDDLLISGKDLCTLIYELYKRGPKYPKDGSYVFIPDNIKLPEDPEDAYDEDDEEPVYEEAPVEEAPVEEVSAEEASTEEAPVEEAPTEETPVEEEPAEEITTEDSQAA